ncbi:nitrogen permease regulator of amino acid transport activity 3-domain-containing protein [Mycotypha africana]|uniref:nitrogen permease regulator of amino acid transport activity 3-domain-containing protein n=1 Tax=Mycotypha africana TaxID=64632 RepID=UPI0023017461|nr:nitrogen permease regulator of amino acid transport activity 3-domain-containing protein [Mycotypha africana]KAI8973553.1 nitrogen permease regulator of amino acid transport activity 3-domain-containing protein [Mycotypha africana]
MSSLLAILVVVNSTRGHHYLFSYPQNPKRSSSFTTTACGGNSNVSQYTFVNDFAIGSSMTAKLLMQESEEQQRRASIVSGRNEIVANNTGKEQGASTGSRADNNNSNSSNNNNNNNNNNNSSSSSSKDTATGHLLKEQQQQQQEKNEEKQYCQEQDRFAGRDSIFDMDVSFLADTLAPKAPLCDRKFQLSIDDLTFVGHPVSLTSQHHPSSSDTPTNQQQNHHHYDVNSPLTSPTSPSQPLTKVVSTPLLTSSQYASPQLQMKTPSTRSVRDNSHSLNNSDDDDDVDGNESNDSSYVKSRNDEQKSTAQENDHSSDDTDSDDSDLDHTKQDERNKKLNGPTSASTHMTLFHVVFVVSPPDLELTSQVNTLYTHVISKYASALRYEQLRCGYVQEEVEKILILKEETFNKGTPYDQVMEQILSESSLAKDIKQIYTAISTNTAAHIIVNDFIDVSLQIPINSITKSTNALNHSSSHEYNHFYYNGCTNDVPIQHPIYYSSGDTTHSLMDIYSVSGYEYDQFPVIAPYHTLLLLEDPEEVLKNMPLDASPTLVQLVQILTPTQSLQELHLLLDCSLAQIYRLAAHLIYWRKAKLIHTISPRNIYVVSPTATFDAALEADFKSHIPNLSLPVILSKLSGTLHHSSSTSTAGTATATETAGTGTSTSAYTSISTTQPKPYHTVYNQVKELKNQYLEAITYLIRKDLVVQLHMYLVLLLPLALLQQQKHTMAQATTTTTTHLPTHTGATHSSSGSGLHSSRNSVGEQQQQQQQQQMEDALPSPNNSNLKRMTFERAPKEVVELFERLAPYMNGQYHIEEIIYREGISRRQLGLVLKYYKDKIVTVYHY